MLLTISSLPPHKLHYYFSPCGFFTSAFIDSFPLEFVLKKFFSSLQDSSQYSGRSRQCCSLDSLHPSRYFQVLQSLYQSFGDCIKSTNFNRYHRHFRVSQFFRFLSKVEVLTPLFAFFKFYSVVRRDSKVHNYASSLFFCSLL